MSRGLPEGVNRLLIISMYLIILIAALLIALPVTLSQELEERLHTDWAIKGYEMIPQNPSAGKEVALRARVGIASIIEPLPQEVEVMLKIDGKQYGVFSLTFERDPTQVQVAQASWTASPGKHRIEWIIDPHSRYDDPNLENNYAALDFEVAPPMEIATTTATVTQTITEPITYTETRITTVEETATRIESITVREVETQTIYETITKPVFETITAPQAPEEEKAITITEAAAASSAGKESPGPMERMINALVAGALGGGLGAALALLAIHQITQRIKLRIAGAARIEEGENGYWHQFSYTIYRLAKKVGEDEWEGRPGDYVEDGHGIVSVDKNGDVMIISDHRALYDSKIMERPLSLEDLKDMKDDVLRGLLGELDEACKTETAMRLQINDAQQESIRKLRDVFEKELKMRKLRTQ